MKNLGPLILLLIIICHSQCSTIEKKEPIGNKNTNLATLCKIWGFLKYYHPEVGQEQINWDSALICYIDEIEKLENSDSIKAFFDNIVPNVKDCSGILTDCDGDSLMMINHNIAWIMDTNVFYKSTIRKFEHLLQYKEPYNNNKIALNPWIKNPDFGSDTLYNHFLFPNRNIRLLSLFRYWNIINYFFPYKYLSDNDWDHVLDSFIPIFSTAKDTLEYHLSVCKLVSKINDNHGYITSSIISNFWGNQFLAVRFRLIEGKTIISQIYSDSIAKRENLKLGDIITEINNLPVDNIRDSIHKYFSGSNDQQIQHTISYYLSRSSKKRINLKIQRNDTTFSIAATTFSRDVLSKIRDKTKKIEAVRPISDKIAYVNLSRLGYNDVDSIVKSVTSYNFLILDLRYNCKFIIHEICNVLFSKHFDFYSVSIPNYITPGTYCYSIGGGTGPDCFNPNYYLGKIIILVDNQTQSVGEYTAMALSMHENAIILGSPTAGADGDVSMIHLPGQIITYISGIGIYWLDGRPTQRVGILPDITIHPKIESVKSGYDDVLEEAIKYAKSKYF